MAQLQGSDRFVRVGLQTDRTTVNAFTGPTQDDHTSPIAWVEWDLNNDGLTAAGSFPSIDIPTEHKERGVKHQIDGDKNRDEATMTGPMYPDITAFFMRLMEEQGSGNELLFFTVQEHWKNALDVGETGAIGRELVGCIMNSFNFTVERGSAGVMLFNMGFFFNQNKLIPNGSVPAYVGNPLNPYVTTIASIDLEEKTTDFSGDRIDVKAVTFTYAWNGILDDTRPNAVSSLNQSWITHRVGIPTLTVSATLNLTSDEYLQWQIDDPKEEFQIRVSVAHGSSSFFQTATVTLVADETSQTITVGSETGLANGDVVQVINADGSLFTTGVVEAVGVGTFDIIGSDVAMSAEAVGIRNTAMEWQVAEMKINAPGNPSGTDLVTLVVGFGASLEVGGPTTLYTFDGINDDNA